MTSYQPESPEEAAFLNDYDPSKFPVTVNTVDMIIHTKTHVLLIKRGKWPYRDCWALPGGFIEQNESTAQAAVRELQEETGIEVPDEAVQFVGVADDPDRDPRCRAISFVYACEVPEALAAAAADDAADAKWIAFSEIPLRLAFDHRKLLTLYFLELAAQERVR